MTNLRQLAERLAAVEAELANLRKQLAAPAGKADQPKSTKAPRRDLVEKE